MVFTHECDKYSVGDTHPDYPDLEISYIQPINTQKAKVATGDIFKFMEGQEYTFDAPVGKARVDFSEAVNDTVQGVGTNKRTPGTLHVTCTNYGKLILKKPRPSLPPSEKMAIKMPEEPNAKVTVKEFPDLHALLYRVGIEKEEFLKLWRQHNQPRFIKEDGQPVHPQVEAWMNESTTDD